MRTVFCRTMMNSRKRKPGSPGGNNQTKRTSRQESADRVGHVHAPRSIYTAMSVAAVTITSATMRSER